MMSTERETLYKVFSRYLRPIRLGGCPCCTDSEAARLLSSLPLQTLPASELSHYAFKAMSTWGTLKDFKYFLPRIFELMALQQLECAAEVTLGKLGDAHWMDWPDEEQKAVWDFVTALWIQCLQTGDIWYADAVLCGISRSASDVSRLLTAADALTPEFRSAYRQEFGCDDGLRLTNSFWDRSLPSYPQVLHWAYDR